MIFRKEDTHENPTQAADYTSLVDWDNDVRWHWLHPVDANDLYAESKLDAIDKFVHRGKLI